MRLGCRTIVGVWSLAMCTLACSSSESEDSKPKTCQAAGGAVTGPADTHCEGDAGPIVQVTSQAACTADPGTDDAGAGPDYGDPLYGSEADDDDCKYHVTWSSTPICTGVDTQLTVIATKKEDGSPLTGANMRADVFSSLTHVAPNAGRTTVEDPPGTYTMRPVHFDEAGQWTVRFHFYDECADEPEDSPHGHVAFFVDVP